MITMDATNKINSIPDSVLAQFGYTREGLLLEQQKENAALLMCGGLLGDCYLMAEIIDTILQPNGWDLTGKLKKQKWFKQEVKTHINKAFDELRNNISICRENSPTDSYYMMYMADSLYNLLKLDLIKLKNGILLELGNKVKNAPVLASLLIVDILSQWISNYYDKVLKEMKDNVYSKADYNSWYYQARFSGVSYNISLALEWYAKKFMPNDINIDLNDSPFIKAGVAVIDTKMNSSEVADIIKKDNEGYEEGKGKELYDKSLGILGIKPINKTLPKPKKQKPNPTLVPIEEQVEVEMTAKDILSQKFKVK